jgi:hypothetical protein
MDPLARKARDRLDSPQNPSKCPPLLSLDSIARVWAAAQKQCPKNDRGSTAFPVATPPRHRARRCYHADKRVRKGARPKALSAAAKALRPALCATALRWARLTRSLRRTGTGMAAVTAGISGMSSGNSSKSATAKANNVSGSVDIPLSRRWITSSRQSPARVFSSKSTAELPLFCIWGRPTGLA